MKAFQAHITRIVAREVEEQVGAVRRENDVLRAAIIAVRPPAENEVPSFRDKYERDMAVDNAHLMARAEALDTAYLFDTERLRARCERLEAEITVLRAENEVLRGAAE